MASRTPLTYRAAGVDIDAGDALVEAIKPFAKRTLRPEVLAGIGGFGALFEVSKKYREPVLVSGTDGVGTKLKLAFQLGRHDTVGIDLVAMSVNDIVTQGAEPLFFLDYFACGKLDVAVATEVVKGVARGCELAGCALIGGETAEMPGMYAEGEYDLAGFAVGVVEKSAIVDGRDIAPGDVVLLFARAQDPGADEARSARRFSRQAARRGAARADPHLRETLARPDARGARQRHGTHHRRRSCRERSAHVARELQGGDLQLDLAAAPLVPVVAARGQHRRRRDASRL